MGIRALESLRKLYRRLPMCLLDHFIIYMCFHVRSEEGTLGELELSLM